jgi:predicted RNA binding protein YcfA (HicA-like mRNA interferase family)
MGKGQGMTVREVLKLLYKDGWKEVGGRTKVPI